MGGIPTNIDCTVLDFTNNEVVGLMAVGEAACVSVHGANRLGCNSLLDLIIFGKIAGKKSAEKIAALSFDKTTLRSNLAMKIAAEKLINLQNLLERNADEEFTKSLQSPDNLNEEKTKSLFQIKADLQNINEKYLGVFRSQNLLETAMREIEALFKIFKKLSIKNKTLLWNEELVGYFELENLFLNSFAAVASAIERKESRGAHYRDDFPARDDENWACHSLVGAEISSDGLMKMKFLTKNVSPLTQG